MNYLENVIRQARLDGYNSEVVRKFESLIYKSWAFIVWAESDEDIQYLYDSDLKQFRELLSRLNLKPAHHFYYESYTYPDGHYSLDCRLTDSGKYYIDRLSKKEADYVPGKIEE